MNQTRTYEVSGQSVKQSIEGLDAQGNPVNRVGGEPLKDVTIPGPYRSAADEHGV